MAVPLLDLTSRSRRNQRRKSLLKRRLIATRKRLIARKKRRLHPKLLLRHQRKRLSSRPLPLPL
jgi:hypothetical protein